jgi:hypothetical protein
LFEELAEIAVSYSYTTAKITENDCIVVVFAKVPEKYSAVLTSQQSAKGAGLTIDDLEDAMNQLWRQGGGSQKKHTSDDGGEILLAAFGGVCYNCQEKGIEQISFPRKPGLVMAIAMTVVTINASLATVKKSAARSRTRASMEEMMNPAHCNQRCHRRGQRWACVYYVYAMI